MFLVSAYRFSPAPENPPVFAISNLCVFCIFSLVRVAPLQNLSIFVSALTRFSKNKSVSGKSCYVCREVRSVFGKCCHVFQEVRSVFFRGRLVFGKCCYAFSTSLLSFRKNRNTFSSEGTTFWKYISVFFKNMFHQPESYLLFLKTSLLFPNASHHLKNVNRFSGKQVVLSPEHACFSKKQTRFVKI